MNIYELTSDKICPNCQFRFVLKEECSNCSFVCYGDKNTRNVFSCNVLINNENVLWLMLLNKKVTKLFINKNQLVSTPNVVLNLKLVEQSKDLRHLVNKVNKIIPLL
jgi:hypothetical protein